VLGVVGTSEAAVTALRERWGYPAALGEVALRRYHDRMVATVRREGTTVLELALVDPEIVAGGDLQYIHAVTLARLDGTAQLVQVDPHYTIHRAARGRAHVSRFEPGAWNAEPIRLTTPISASSATCDTDLPRIRFVMDPEIPVIRGTRRVR
jgi:Acetoacetate decarboxylase (ADC)